MCNTLCTKSRKCAEAILEHLTLPWILRWRLQQNEPLDGREQVYVSYQCIFNKNSEYKNDTNDIPNNIANSGWREFRSMLFSSTCFWGPSARSVPVAYIFPPNAKLVIVHQNVVHIHLNPTLGVLFFDSVQERVEPSCRVIVPSKVYLVPEVQIVK